MKTRILILILLMFAVALPGLAQKKAASGKDIVATTEDGRKVVLKADGTWQFVQAPVIKAESGPVKIASWKGQGLKKTESFLITTPEWVVAWATRPDSSGFDGNFIVEVHKEGSSQFPDTVVNVVGKDEDQSRMRGKGKYWLEVTASQLWVLAVFEIRK
jgi:hypothetical protein